MQYCGWASNRLEPRQALSLAIRHRWQDRYSSVTAFWRSSDTLSLFGSGLGAPASAGGLSTLLKHPCPISVLVWWYFRYCMKMEERASQSLARIDSLPLGNFTGGSG